MEESHRASRYSTPPETRSVAVKAMAASAAFVAFVLLIAWLFNGTIIDDAIQAFNAMYGSFALATLLFNSVRVLRLRREGETFNEAMQNVRERGGAWLTLLIFGGVLLLIINSLF